jgi:hypothetical protein
LARGEIAHVLLYRHRTEEAQQEGHGVETFFAVGQCRIEQPDGQQPDGEHQRDPAQAVIDARDRRALEAVAHALLQ